MGLLNLASDGLPSVLVVLARTVHARGPLARASLLDLCAPKSLTRDQKQAGQTLRTWTDLGLFVENDGEVRLADEFAAAANEAASVVDVLPRIARTLIMHPQNNSILERDDEGFWENEGARGDDFIRALAWALAQNVYEFGCKSAGDALTVQRRQLALAEYPFQNDTRWSGFRSWATFLGFAWETGTSDALVMDPTIAIRDALPVLFADARRLDHATFFNSLARVLPVVDGGRYRAMVEDRLDPESWPKPRVNELSTSLSRALQRLETSELIEFEVLADTGSQRRLVGYDGSTRPITHVRLA